MIVSMPITKFRGFLNGVFLSEMDTPCVITVTGLPARVIVDVPTTAQKLEVIKQELDELYHSFELIRQRGMTDG